MFNPPSQCNGTLVKLESRLDVFGYHDMVLFYVILLVQQKFLALEQVLKNR